MIVLTIGSLWGSFYWIKNKSSDSIETIEEPPSLREVPQNLQSEIELLKYVSYLLAQEKLETETFPVSVKEKVYERERKKLALSKEELIRLKKLLEEDIQRWKKE